MAITPSLTISEIRRRVKAQKQTVVSQFEVARASCPCYFMAKMAMPLQTETLPNKQKQKEQKVVGQFDVSAALEAAHFKAVLLVGRPQGPPVRQIGSF